CMIATSTIRRPRVSATKAARWVPSHAHERPGGSGNGRGGLMGSAAEERIRAKAEVMLRATFPDARIVHELVLQQGGVRIDLAAITPDRLVCVEVKSERDVLARLPEQVAAMRRVCDAWCVVTAEKHLDECRRITSWNA